MPLPAVLVTVTAAERKALKKRIRGTRTAWRDRLRAQIVLAAAMGRSTARIARDLRISQDTARKWRGRFADRGLEGLSDLPRPGRPRQISAEVRAAVVALACQLPAVTGVPLAHWTGPELAAELTAQNLVSSPVSASSVLRILAEHPVKPWQYQSWIYPRDPDFEAKAKVIVDLYQGFYQGEPLGAGDRILSFDAKPQINARRRLHPTLPAAPGRPVRYEHEYKRQGSLALLAGLDVPHPGEVLGCCRADAAALQADGVTGGERTGARNFGLTRHPSAARESATSRSACSTPQGSRDYLRPQGITGDRTRALVFACETEITNGFSGPVRRAARSPQATKRTRSSKPQWPAALPLGSPWAPGDPGLASHQFRSHRIGKLAAPARSRPGPLSYSDHLSGPG